MSARKVIITCAVTGSIHTPWMSPHLPVTAEEIAEAAIGTQGRAGASAGQGRVAIPLVSPWNETAALGLKRPREEAR